jgi:hypothetical protein
MSDIRQNKTRHGADRATDKGTEYGTSEFLSRTQLASRPKTLGGTQAFGRTSTGPGERFLSSVHAKKQKVNTPTSKTKGIKQRKEKAREGTEACQEF